MVLRNVIFVFELGPFSFGNGEQLIWDYVHRFALPAIQHTSMERHFWFKNWKGTINEKETLLNEQEQEVPLFQLMNYFRPKLEQLTEDMPFIIEAIWH